MNHRFTCHGMLTLECQEPMQWTFDKTQASALAERVSSDLHSLLRIQSPAALVFCGAAFAAEQLLQPGYPIHRHISQYASAAFQGQSHENQVLSIGSHNGLMPAGLQPKTGVQQLLHLPFCLYTDDEEVAQAFESQLMHKGMLPPPTYETLVKALSENHQSVQVNHANYMTNLDLVAMMHNHFEQLGMSHLWQIIETALVNAEPKSSVSTPTHNHYFLVDHLLFTPFFSWSQFSQYFNTETVADYVRWLLAQRLSLAAFKAHGLEVKQFQAVDWPPDSQKICLGSFERQLLSGDFWLTTVPKQAHHRNHPDQVVYHQDQQAGVVAVSVPNIDTIQVYYPITAKGIQAITETIQAQLMNPREPMTADLKDNANWLL